MPHDNPTPESERPTLEEMELRDAYAEKHTTITIEARGLWEDSEEEFRVLIKGDSCDVREVIENIKDDGNLMGLEFTKLDPLP